MPVTVDLCVIVTLLCVIHLLKGTSTVHAAPDVSDPCASADEEETLVVDAMRHWEEHTCIRFHQRTNQFTYINFFQGSGCCSYVGFLNYGRQGISLARRCLKFPTIVHEIGHAIGFWHEHTRPDRDNYVDIFFDNIQDRYEKNFEKVDATLIDSHGVGYDYNSIMHYDSDFFARVNGRDTLSAKDNSIPVGLAVELSPMDILQTNRLYANKCGRPNRTSTLPAHITPTPPPLPFSCGELLTTINGSFTSPLHPASYPPDTDCGWLIQPPGGFLIALELWNVSVEQSVLCTKDYIKVYEGEGEGGTLRSRLCATYQSYLSIISGAGSVYVRFHSDSTNQFRGFHAVFKLSDLDECAGGARCTHYCRNTFGGYECYCRDGFYLSADGHTCFDINECGMNHGGCNELCINTGGSYHCSCPPGQRLEPDQVSCRPIGASCSFRNGDCNHNCTETVNSRFCSCHRGFRLEPDGRTCHDVDECSSSSGHMCTHDCVNTRGSYRCSCRRGFLLDSDNHTCLPERVCAVDNGNCDHVCRNKPDGSALCSCRRGYRLSRDETTCEDIDECRETRHLCSHRCVNTDGSYHCECREGYGLETDQKNCVNLDECRLGIDECQHSELCRDTFGSYLCGCPIGYLLGADLQSCSDADECELGYNALCSQGCRNLPGTYECTCREGFILQSSWLCVDVNECIEGTHRCSASAGASCVNTVGSYICLCPYGFRSDGTGIGCEDIDECSRGLHHCDSSMYCVNTPGHYTCQDTPPISTTESVSTFLSTENTPLTASTTKAIPLATGIFTAAAEAPTDLSEAFMTESVSSATHTLATEPAQTSMTAESPTTSTTALPTQPPTTTLTIKLPLTTALPTQPPSTAPPKTSAPTTQPPSTEPLLSTTVTMEHVSSTSQRPLSTEPPRPSLEPSADEESDPCETAECEHECRITVMGAAECYCRDGYTIEDEKSCRDIDECADGLNGGCSHVCVNSPGSFSCNCPQLHYLSVDSATCVYFGPRSTEPELTTPIDASQHQTVPVTANRGNVVITTPSSASNPIDTTTDAATTFQATPPNHPTTPTNSPTILVPTEYHCGGILADDVGSFHSENWPQTYPVNVVCEWEITLPNPRLVLEIRFNNTPFGLAGKMPQCKRDWVKVHGMDTNRTILSTWGPYCGFGTPPPISTRTSSAVVQFHSGFKHGNSRKGFRVYYQALEVCVPPPPPLIVEGSFTCSSVIRIGEKFGPPQFPEFITTETMQSCRWIYYGGPAAYLRLMYFDLPESENCAEDSLRIYRGISVNDNHLIGTPICGHLGARGRKVYMNTTYFTIQLKLTTRDGSFRGFHAVMEPT